MRPRKTPGDIEMWLRENGWSPERNVEKDAEDAIARREEDLRRQGYPMRAPAVVHDFLRSYGLLELSYPGAPELALCLNPEIGYTSDGEEIAELAGNLGTSLFPVGFETEEGGVIVMDESGRVFYIHHTGFYFMGQSFYEALISRLSGDLLQDAEDFYV
ncbi:SUKH-3 domain-containing protein [Streptomyces luteireticuli]|uniref:SUKH-3 domain containing protein n=1 Tax=Streptomyces luteireticuli TaxID=173858 RepID=A0ABP3IUN6_9ACTN